MGSSTAGFRSSFQIPNPNKKARTMESGVQTSPPKALSKSVEWANLLEVGCKTMLPDSPDSSLEMLDDSISEKKALTPRKPEYAQVYSYSSLIIRYICVRVSFFFHTQFFHSIT